MLDSTPRRDWLRARRPLSERFHEKFRVDEETGCWIWTGARSGGYGHIGSGHGKQVNWAHRVSYELHVGPVPDRMELDHLCRNQLCVNPGHLEAVTHRENVLRGSGPSARQARQTHCKYGHAFTPENTAVTPAGRRRCRACNREYLRRRYRESRR